MPSLGDTYERRAGVASRRQVVLGTGLFATGALLVVVGILAGATGLLIGNGFTVFQGREIAGILAGLGLPAVFVGVTIVLPATRVHRAAAVLGSGLAVLGVVLFHYAYPYRWYAGQGVPSELTFAMAVVYFLGVMTTVWAFFTAVATFKTRNDPGGTVSLSVTPGAVPATVERAREDFNAARAALGGAVGVFGALDDPEPLYKRSKPADASASDGGTDTVTLRTPLEQRRSETRPDEGVEVISGGVPQAVEPDRYCGNCKHFDYAREGADMRPYCGLKDETMDDVDACPFWASNKSA